MSLAVQTKMYRHFIWILVIHLARLVYAQNDQSGFISLDCGAPQLSYTDNATGINYVRDDDFIESGVTYRFSSPSNVFQLTSLRYFPENERNCYTLKPQQGKNNRYLIRARIGYGNYDYRDQNPQFDLYLGADYWDTVNITNSAVAITLEMIHLSLSDYIHVCLVNTGHGTPTISALELRLLNITMYEGQFQSLILSQRQNFGTNDSVRYKDDIYDRIWRPSSMTGCRAINNSDLVSAGPSDEEKVPLKVITTAYTPINSTNMLRYTWVANATERFIIYIHIAEVELLESNQKREFNIYINGAHLFGPFSPSTRLTTITNQSTHTGFSSYELELIPTLDSTLPPLYNAIEIYTVKQLVQNQTQDRDVAAISNTKYTYGLKRNWQGDPCVPQAYAWDGLNCSYKDTLTPRIISLNLSSSGLMGEIATALANLTIIESLDLSNNNLTGIVPKFLADLDFLTFLNLTGNNFTRPLPTELLAKSKNRSLFLSIEVIGDQDKGYCLNGLCENKKHTKVVIPVIVAIAVVMVLLMALFVIVWKYKWRKTKDLTIKDDAFKQRNQHYSYSEVKSITNNFMTVTGKGGFGTVFRGSIGGNQVAVKMLSESSSQGYKEFQAEVKLLMDVRHKNITSLVGYCNDSNHKAIIYEYMSNGDLRQHLFDQSSNVLSWERRLQIGCDAAEGLVYMHDGCRPPIVHRDVKPTNILLNESFQAKLADFGMSRAITTEDATCESTRIVGTLGYLDPEYHSSNRLTMKSDVYSFGIVLLELITSRRAVSENINIIDWVKSTIAEGHVEQIIDPKLQGNFNRATAWKVVELAFACVSHSSIKRPTMSDVVMELKYCLQEQIHHSVPDNENVSLNLDSMSYPMPR